MRPGVVCFVLLALAGALNASGIGVAVNGVCENASCPPPALAGDLQPATNSRSLTRAMALAGLPLLTP